MQMNLSQNGWLAAVVILVMAVMAFAVGLVSFQLLAANIDSATVSSPSGLQIITSNGREELSIVRGTSANEGQVIKRLSTGQIGWDDDSTTTVTGAGAVAFDAGNDGDNSTGIIRIVTDNDTNGIATESPADTILFDFSNNYPVADSATTAVALAANGANCIANQFNKGVDASGAAETCAALVDADVPDSITITLAATATVLAANPSDCAADNFANAIAASGNLTCAQVNFTNLAGTATDAQIPDTITITLAATATALAANPADCAASNFATTIAANGDLTCAQVDFTDLTGTATDAQIPNTITIDIATALAANGANCSAGSAPLGVDALGAVESCTDYEEDLVNSAGLAAALSDESGTGLVVFNDSPTLTATVTVTGAGTTFTLNLDCTANTNGGALTADAAGLVTCSDDDGGAGAGDINDVGDCSSGACFTADGTGTTLWMEGSTADAFEQIIATADVTGDHTFTFPNATMIDDDIFIGTGSGTFEYRHIGDCQDTSGQHLNYTAVGNIFSCGTSVGDVALNDLTDAIITSAVDKQTLTFNGSNWDNEYPLDIFKQVRNVSGSTLNRGELVYITGFNVGQDLITVDLADADGSGTFPSLGVVWDATIVNNTNGEILVFGQFDDIDTSTCSVNDEVFLSTTPGTLTCTRPTGATDQIQELGHVLRSHATLGRIELIGSGHAEDGPNLADDNVRVGNTSSVATAIPVPDCDDSSGNHLNYDTGTNAFSCGTSSSVTDTGPSPDCAGTTTYQDGEGGCDTLDGLEDFETATDDSVPVGNGSTFDIRLLTNCQSGLQAVTYATGSNTFGCNTFVGGRSITGSGSTFDAHPELFTDTKSFALLDPTTSETNLIQLKLAQAATLLRVSCSTNTGTASIQFDERVESTPNSAGTNMLTATLVCDSDTEVTTSFSNATIDATDPMNLQITATASSPGVLRVHIDYEYDD